MKALIQVISKRKGCFFCWGDQVMEIDERDHINLFFEDQEVQPQPLGFSVLAFFRVLAVERFEKERRRVVSERFSSAGGGIWTDAMRAADGECWRYVKFVELCGKKRRDMLHRYNSKNCFTKVV